MRGAFFDSYLLHFEKQKYPYHYSLGELAALVDLAPVAVVSDGGIYRVSRRGPEGRGAALVALVGRPKIGSGFRFRRSVRHPTGRIGSVVRDSLDSRRK